MQLLLSGGFEVEVYLPAVCKLIDRLIRDGMRKGVEGGEVMV